MFSLSLSWDTCAIVWQGEKSSKLSKGRLSLIEIVEKGISVPVKKELTEGWKGIDGRLSHFSRSCCKVDESSGIWWPLSWRVRYDSGFSSESQQICRKVVSQFLHDDTRCTTHNNTQTTEIIILKSRKNKSKKRRKNLSGSSYKDDSHAYNSGMELSRLQRIYHKHNATYYPPKESVSIVSANEIRRTYFFSCKCTCNEKRCLVSMASDLEAFSR